MENGSTTGPSNGNLRLNEDALTSSVFERLLYLPEDMFWGILAAVIGDERLSEGRLGESGEIVDTSFWKTFPFTERPGDRHREPDLVIWTPKQVLIIESKLETGSQGPQQWAEQVWAVHNSMKQKLPILHLAVGGFGRFPSSSEVRAKQDQASKLIEEPADEVLDVSFKACSWHQFASVASQMQPAYGNERRLLQDVLAALACYNILPTAWLDKLTERSSELRIGAGSLEAISSLGIGATTT